MITLNTTLNSTDGGSITLIVGLTMYFYPEHNNIIRPSDKTYSVCKLTIVTYFDKLTIWGEELPEML